MGKYLSLTAGQLKFTHSFQFTPNGLDVLAKSLADDEVRYLRGSCTSNYFGLSRRKGVYPYDYMDSFDRFDETKLHSQDGFFSKLSGSPRLDSEYTHATRVWTAFGCRTMAFFETTFLKRFVQPFYSTTVSIRYIITPLLVLPGMRFSEYHMLICNL